MKRMIAFFIVISLIVGIKFMSQESIPQFNYEKLVIVSKLNSLFEIESVKNGSDYYYTFDKILGEKVLKNINKEEIESIVFYFDRDYSLKKIQNKMDYIYKGGSVSELEIYYGYDKDYSDYRIIDGKKVNVQIVKNSTNIIVGYPLILTGY